MTAPLTSAVGFGSKREPDGTGWQEDGKYRIRVRPEKILLTTKQPNNASKQIVVLKLELPIGRTISYVVTEGAWSAGGNGTETVNCVPYIDHPREHYDKRQEKYRK